MRKPIAIAVAVALAGVLAATALAGTRTVTVGDNYFVRDGGVPTVTVRKGTTVKWVWTGTEVHNVRVVKGPVRFKSEFKTSGTYRKRMRRRGTYVLICDVHGRRDQSMRLVVK